MARLASPDAAGRSDRAIARELGLSQPFIGSVRRRLAAGDPVHADPVLVDNEPAAREADADLDVLGGDNEPEAPPGAPHTGLPAHQALAVARYGSIRPSWAPPVERAVDEDDDSPY